MNERSPEQMLADARRIDEFLKDEAIDAAFRRMERSYYEEFIAASSSEARVQAWAKANVLKDFERELKIIRTPLDVEEFNAAKRKRAADTSKE